MYFCDFTNNRDGWRGYGVFSHQGGNGGHFLCSSPFDDDHNHDQSVGTMLLLAYYHKEFQRVDGSFQTADMTGRLATARIKLENWSGPSSQQFYWWAQARIPGTGPNWKYSNWASLVDANVFDGNWHEISALYSDDPEKWFYAAGGDPNVYQEASLAVTMANIQDIILVAARPVNTAQPTGTFRMDWISVE